MFINYQSKLVIFPWIMLWIFFVLAYPCFSCCVWTAMTGLCTRADDHTGAGEP